MKYSAFMVMPFSDEIVRSAYENCLVPLFERKSVKIRKADEIFSTNPIYGDIVAEIKDCDIVVVDISGKNPNVFYELGVAHTLKQQQTVILTHEPYAGTPFDIAHFRIIQYSDSLEGSKKLERSLGETIDYVLGENRLIYRRDFELLETSFASLGQHSTLLCLLAIDQLSGAAPRFSGIRGTGHYPEGKTEFSSISIENALRAMIALKYVRAEGDKIFVEVKGKAFADFLREKGYALGQAATG
jgi:hypothetical protein